MNTADFEKLFDARVDLCRRVLIGKNTDYARGGDKLHNFYEAAEMDGCTPEMAAKGMLLKHWQSLRDLVDDIDRGIYHARGHYAEKIGDSLNYLFLLNALIEERQNGGRGC